MTDPSALSQIGGTLAFAALVLALTFLGALTVGLCRNAARPQPTNAVPSLAPSTRVAGRARCCQRGHNYRMTPERTHYQCAVCGERVDRFGGAA